MEQKDYLQRQVDQLSKALAKLLGKAKELEANSDERQVIENEFHELLGFSIEELISIKPEDLELFLNQKSINETTVEAMVSILFYYAKNNNGIKKDSLNEHVLQLYKILQKHSKTLSFELISLVNSLNNN